MGRAKGRAVIAGLDVGTTKICCVIAEPAPAGGLDIVGVGVSPSRGLRKGVVVNIDSTVEAVRQAVAEAEQVAGVEIGSVVAGIAGGHIRGINSRGVVAVSGKHREVSQADVDRALESLFQPGCHVTNRGAAAAQPQLVRSQLRPVLGDVIERLGKLDDHALQASHRHALDRLAYARQFGIGRQRSLEPYHREQRPYVASR